MPNPIETSVVWGGLYLVKHNRWDDSRLSNDQIYKQAVPCLDEHGNVWMQDTHQIRSHGLRDNSSTLAAMDYIFTLDDPQKGKWAISQSSMNWYHKGNEKITDVKMLEDYELICDLHDYRPLNRGEDYRQYDVNDIIHGIHLYSEHGYSWERGDIGVTLVHTGAKPILYNKFLAALSDAKQACRYPSFYTWKKDTVVKLYDDLKSSGIYINERDEVAFNNFLWLSNRLKEMSQEIDDYMKEHKYRPKYDFEAQSNIRLENLHPDIDRYLTYDCYCPGEIYGIDGFGYQIFSKETVCKLVGTSPYSIVAIARTSDSSEPQILFFFTSHSSSEKLTKSLRVDVTENNLKEAYKKLDDEYYNMAIDHYEVTVDSKHLNDLINSIESR